jgi:hypothetical protein
MLRYVPSISNFFEPLIVKDLEFTKDFFYMYLDDHVVFVLDCVYLQYYIYQLGYVEPSLHPWNEPNLIMVYDFLMCC